MKVLYTRTENNAIGRNISLLLDFNESFIFTSWKQRSKNVKNFLVLYENSICTYRKQSIWKKYYFWMVVEHFLFQIENFDLVVKIKTRSVFFWGNIFFFYTNKKIHVMMSLFQIQWFRFYYISCIFLALFFHMRSFSPFSRFLNHKPKFCAANEGPCLWHDGSFQLAILVVFYDRQPIIRELLRIPLELTGQYAFDRIWSTNST